ncbi:hypothetical protein PQR37_19660 [Paraburkholderia nemoris]|uniref:glutamine amidotransferase-related protein n=1 Tax=Paraburkholderia nemoris TaxID=2793076 RepID=UPI0038BDB294
MTEIAAILDPTHGKTWRIRHSGRGLFAGLHEVFSVARYHSLMLERPLPPSLLETAWTEEGLLMGFEHRERPQWGVEFLLESAPTAPVAAYWKIFAISLDKLPTPAAFS